MQNPKKLLIIFILILTTLVAFWQVKDLEFVGYDDGLYVTENFHVQAGLTLENIKWAFTTFHAGNWHPLTWLSHMLDCELYGLNPMGHHWTSLQIHIANTLLLFFILQYMTGALWQSAFVAALFALHPIHVESVAWVSERKDVLSAFFGMLTILAYIRYVKKRNLLRYFLVFILLSLGLMAKPMLVTLPFVLLLLDFWPLGRLKYYSFHRLSKSLSLIYEKIPLFIPVVISSVLTILAQKEVGALYAFEVLPITTRISNALISYNNYIIKTIWPQNLAVYYPHPFGSLSLWYVFGAALLISGLLFLSVYTIRKYPYIIVGLLWFLGTLVPVIGLIQVGSQAMADRYTYIPLIGLFLIIVWGGSDLLKKWTHKHIVYAALLSIAVFSALTVRSFQQTYHWKNSITLFKNAVNVIGNHPDLHYNIGINFAVAGRYEKAIYHYKEALKIKPNHVEALWNLGTVLYDYGKTDDAIFYLQKAIDENPDHTNAHNNLANILYIQGKPEEAILHYKKILRINPQHANAHSNLANIFYSQGKIDKAAFHFKKALAINPKHDGAHYNFGVLLVNQHQHKEALFHFAEVIRINQDYAPAYNEIGIILLHLGKIKKAENFFSKAVQIDPGYKEAISNLLILEQITQQDEK